jgi:hypothetical protein
MIRTTFALALAALAIAGVAGTARAAPIAPLAAGVRTEAGQPIPVYWVYHRHYYHHHCWRGPHGYVHCR